MALPKVYFTRGFDAKSISEIFSRVLAEKKLAKDKTAIKLHFGEKGNTRFLSPKLVKPIIDKLRSMTGELFLTDTNTLYRGMRLNATDHKKIAHEHGFGELDLPIIIADGEKGSDDVEVEISGKHFKKARIAKAIADTGQMVVVSHFKGHVLFGFGGALKNLAMGCGSRAGKLAMHSHIRPDINRQRCTACMTCIKNCPVDAISLTGDDKKASIGDACIGCAECISVCPEGAVRIPWHGATPEQAMERGAEYASAATRGRKCLYITFINNVTSDCDCMGDSDIIAKDVGIVASTDPVAADKAAYDLLCKDNDGEDVFEKAGRPDGTHILSYAEELGIGKMDYDLVELA